MSYICVYIIIFIYIERDVYIYIYILLKYTCCIKRCIRSCAARARAPHGERRRRGVRVFVATRICLGVSKDTPWRKSVRR